MILKNIVDEDFVNYKKPSMFLIFPYCDFKCCLEQNISTAVCQNQPLTNQKNIDITIDEVIHRFINNPITKSIVMGGMEPFKSFEDVLSFVHTLRKEYNNHSTIVIYTGYYPNEIKEQLQQLEEYDNILIKYGRYLINSIPRFEPELGVTLQSENQYAEWLS